MREETHFSQAAISNKIGILLICFFGFDLSGPMLEGDGFIEGLYIVLSSLVKWCSFFNLLCFDLV